MMTKSKTDRCCGHSTNGALRLVMDNNDAPSTFKKGDLQNSSIDTSRCLYGVNFPYPKCFYVK